MSENSAGFVVVLDSRAGIKRVLTNDLLPENQLVTGTPFRELPDSSSREKADLFLECVAERGAALLWEMHLQLSGRIEPVLFSGVRKADEMGVVCSTSARAVFDLYETLVKSGDQKAEDTAAFLKEHVLAPKLSEGTRESLLDEISRLNNELVNAQRETAKKNRLLETLNTQKNVLLGMAAHDLRNPLGVIRNFADFLLEEHSGFLDETCDSILNLVRDTSQNLLNMVEDLLDVSVIESGKLRLRTVATDLVQLVNQSVGLHRHMAESKDIKVDFQTKGEVPLVSADRSKISQVADNLISNAVKYSEPGSLVRVELEKRDGNVALSVTDRGQGIKKTELDSLFRPFAKVSSRPTGNESSTGLGLAIVKRIVEAHGGEIRVESRPGEGSRFEVMLPERPGGS
jgi:signal transduction histidine kinase